VLGPVLILAHAADAGAASVAARLAELCGRERVRRLAPEALGLARWSHRVDARGRASTTLVPPRAAPVHSADLTLVFSRLRTLPAPRFHRASPRDRDYADSELQALVSSWLFELGARVVPSLRRHPWLVPVVPALHWASASAAAGLPVARATSLSAPVAAAARSGGADAGPAERCSLEPEAAAAPAGTVLVAGPRAAGELAERHGAACLAAAARLGLPLLEFRFALAGARPVLVHVEPLPALSEPWEVEAVSRWLQASSEGRP
jgi:hypothetical protein